MVPDKYLALFAWMLLLTIYVGFTIFGRESKVIEGMLATSFGSLIMALQAGIKRMEGAPYRGKERREENL
jgi:hypothetical protein